MNDQQVNQQVDQRYTAWAELARHPQWQECLDDLQTIIAGMPAEQQAGAWRVFGAITLRASALRRHQRRGGTGRAKTR